MQVWRAAKIALLLAALMAPAASVSAATPIEPKVVLGVIAGQKA